MTVLNTYLVWRPEHGESVDDAMRFDAGGAIVAATLAAEHCHAHRSGWEWNWPITFAVQRFDGGEVRMYEVQRHLVPEFEAEPTKAVRQ